MRTSPPLVSVLLPARDAEAHLHECISSLRSQTFTDFEVIAVDDGSRDGTTEQLRAAWGAHDHRVHVVRQESLGLVSALECARALAHGEYLARMDADDVAAPERLERQLALMRARQPTGRVWLRDPLLPRIARAGPGARRYQEWINALLEPGEIERDLFVECPVAHPTFFLRADAVAAVGGYREMGWPEDYDLVLRLWEAGGRFAKVGGDLLLWREGPGRLSRVHPSYGPEAFRRLKVDVLRRTLLEDRDGALVWGAGPTGKAFARALVDQSVRVRAFVDLDPRKVGQTVHGVPVVAPGDLGPAFGALSAWPRSGGPARARRSAKRCARSGGASWWIS